MDFSYSPVYTVTDILNLPVYTVNCNQYSHIGRFTKLTDIPMFTGLCCN